MNIGIDGVSLYKSSKTSMYPIVGVILNLPPHLRTKKENMILLGIIICNKKPESNMFLERFCSNFATYYKKGMMYMYMYFIIDVKGFYCDYFFPNGKQKKVNCKLWICHWEVDGKRKFKKIINIFKKYYRKSFYSMYEEFWISML